MERHIGIDFGTTNTVVSYRDMNGKIKKVTESGKSSVKTAVFFKSEDDYIIGEDALARGAIHPLALVTNFKPNIKGEKYEITAEDGTTFSKKPVAIARMFLNKLLKDYIETRFSKRFNDAELTAEDKVVVTVPVKFSPEEKKLIKKAAKKAGYPNLSLSFEPTAAAIAISEGISGRAFTGDDIIAVYDFGGGTFDISVIKKRENGTHKALRNGQNGDKKLGGNAVTKQVIKDLLLDPLEEHGIMLDIETDITEEFEFDEDEFGVASETEYRRNWYQAKQLAEDIKTAFSEEDCLEDDFTNENFTLYEKPVDFSIHLTREEYHKCIFPLIEQTVELTDKTISKTETEHGVTVNKIILVGGSSKILLVRELMRKKFTSKGIEVISSDKPFDMISIGAMILGEKSSSIKPEEVTPAQYGIAEREGFRLKFTPLILENVPLPTSGKKRYPITSDMLKSHEISVRFYEKDVAAYPDAEIINRDNGLNLIDEYSISIPENCNPENAEISFIIEEDGTIRLAVEFSDGNFNSLLKINEVMDAESDLD